MHFQRFPCKSWNFLSCFSCCTFRRSNCARLKSIALGQFNLKTVGYLPKDLRILSNMEIEQLLQLRYKTKLLDWEKPGSLSIIIFLPLHMMKVVCFPKKWIFILKNHAELWLISGSSWLEELKEPNCWLLYKQCAASVEFKFFTNCYHRIDLFSFLTPKKFFFSWDQIKYELSFSARMKITKKIRTR